jgi:hypothetical protein
MTSGYYQVVLPADIEWLATAFLTPILNPTPVRTRLPKPADFQDDIGGVNGFMRIEAGDTHPVTGTWGAAYDITFLMHAYDDDEGQASQISRTALAHCAAATGLTVVGWYIVSVTTVIGGRRLTDPEDPTGLVRYRSAITWRVAGQPQ